MQVSFSLSNLCYIVKCRFLCICFLSKILLVLDAFFCCLLSLVKTKHCDNCHQKDATTTYYSCYNCMFLHLFWYLNMFFNCGIISLRFKYWKWILDLSGIRLGRSGLLVLIGTCSTSIRIEAQCLNKILILVTLYSNQWLSTSKWVSCRLVTRFYDTSAIW